jgi:DNA repair protein RecO (recombination protein O)
MPSFHSEALVLRTSDLGESDRIVRLLTADAARLSALAKGARRSQRRFPGTLDLFHHVSVHLERSRRSSLMRLEQARLIDPFLKLRARASRFALACYLLELVDRLAPEGEGQEEARRLFGFALGVLRVLEASRPDARLRTLLELRTLAALGLKPELSRCVRCGRGPGAGAQVAFHVPEGGPVCPACRGQDEGLVLIHLGTLRSLEQGLRLPLERIDRVSLGPSALAEARQLAARFQRFHLGFALRSEPFLDRTLSPAVRSLS